MDADLRSVQEARALLRRAHDAHKRFAKASQGEVDAICQAMAEAGIREAKRLGQEAHDETGFGRPDSKEQKNLFATRTLLERMRGMRTAGVIRKSEGDTIWEIATPMGVVAALVPSTNPTSTAMYKAIIAAKARCGIVMSPHPSAKRCTAEALRVVAEAAYKAGAPQGLFGCLSEPTLEGTNALLEHELADVILATGGGAMVRAAYSKGKPAYGVGSGNVPVYVDRSADLVKAAKDITTGTAFDWGTLCSTERAIVADLPIARKLKEALQAEGAYFCDAKERDLLRKVIAKGGKLNPKQVGQAPRRLAEMAGFRVPEGTKALVGEVDRVGKEEPLSMETLSPVLAFYTADGWQAGCDRCIEILHFGGIGHTLGLHAGTEHVIEAFALQKPAMRIVVNTVAALGSVGMTTQLFPAMTLGPGTIGGSITSDNISPLHLLNVKRLAFETDPLNPPSTGAATRRQTGPLSGRRVSSEPSNRLSEIEQRLLARAGNPTWRPPPAAPERKRTAERQRAAEPPSSGTLPMPDDEVQRLIDRYRK